MRIILNNPRMPLRCIMTDVDSKRGEPRRSIARYHRDYETGSGEREREREKSTTKGGPRGCKEESREKGWRRIGPRDRRGEKNLSSFRIGYASLTNF